MKLDALVLLGCRVHESGALSQAAERRVERAAEAYREAERPLVIASGGRRWNGACEADALERALARLGVAPEHIVCERESLSTRENALFSARILRQRGARHVGVVTCDWHLPRAVACFRKAGIDALGLGAKSPLAPRTRRVVRGARERVSRAIDGPVVGLLTRLWRSR